MVNSTTSLANLAIAVAGGTTFISSITANSVAASAVSNCLSAMRQATLRENPWKFAITRHNLSASATTPTHVYSTQYDLPAGFLRLLPPDRLSWRRRPDWVLEQSSSGNTVILTNDTGTLPVRCITDVTTVSKWDTLFYLAVANRVAWFICEQITGSSTKKAALDKDYDKLIDKAKQVNAIERAPPDEVDEDDWVTVRGGSVQDWSKYAWWN